MPLSDKRESRCLIVQENIKEGASELKSTIVLNEPQFPEFERVYSFRAAARVAQDGGVGRFHPACAVSKFNHGST